MPSTGGMPPLEGWQDRFCETLAQTGLIKEACKRAGCSRAYVYKQRKKDPDFAKRWQEVLEHQTEVLEQIAVKRAAEGSDTLMIFLLKARKPGVYRENVHHQHEHQHQVDGEIRILPDGVQPIQIEAAKRREAAAMLLAGPDGDEIPEAEVVEDEEQAVAAG